MTAEEFQLHSNNSDGICSACKEISYGSIEPDARNYPCEVCGEEAVVGMEDALIEGLINIKE